jgi:hypothetical protein
VIGLLVAGAAVTVAAMLLSITVQALNQASYGQGPLVNIVGNQIEESALVPFFLRLSPHFIRLIEPWFPGGLPQLLSSVA